MLLVHAHPDDETLTTGGTIAAYVAAGVRVTVVTCTLGEQGEIIPAELDQLGSWAGDQLGGFRAGELDGALAALGVDGPRYLGGIGCWRDSGMAGTASAEHPRAFGNGDHDKQVRQLTELLDELRPQVVVTYDEDGGYGHPDHIRAHEITVAAAADHPSVRRVFHTVMPASELARGQARLRATDTGSLRLPADGELPSVPDERVSTTIDTAAHTETTMSALRAHRTQVTVPVDPPRCFALSNGIAQALPETEHFVLARGPADGAHDDLFGGLGL